MRELAAVRKLPHLIAEPRGYHRHAGTGPEQQCNLARSDLAAANDSARFPVHVQRNRQIPHYSSAQLQAGPNLRKSNWPPDCGP